MDKLNETSADSVMAKPAAGEVPNDGTGVLQLDPWLKPFEASLKSRFAKAQNWIKTIDKTEGGLDQFSKGYEKYGFTVAPDNPSHTENGRRSPCGPT